MNWTWAIILLLGVVLYSWFFGESTQDELCLWREDLKAERARQRAIRAAKQAEALRMTKANPI